MKANLIVLTFCCLPLGQSLAAEKTAKPNVLFFFTDDQRADTIGALGNKVIVTPALDRLARRGFVFNNAYVFGSNEPAVCHPSRNMLLSGRVYFRHEMTMGKNRKRRYASGGKPNFPDSMKSVGYETYHHGKSGNVAALIHKKFDHTKYVVHHNTFAKIPPGTVQPGKIVVDEAIEFLRSRPTDKPFFMYLAISEPHDMRIPAKEFLDLYRREDIPLSANYLPMHPFDNGELTIRDELLEAWPRSQDAVRRHLHEYYGMISGLDHHFGRLLETLKQLDQFDSTIVIFASDNGLAVGSHGLMGKQSLYEHSAKVPLIFAGPGVPKGQSDALVYLHDIYPTVCEMVGAPIPEKLDGCSLEDVIRGTARGVRDSVFLSYRDSQRALREQRWKLVRYPLVDVTQLFDLAADPDELHNLAEEPGQAARVRQMLGSLAKQQRQYGDQQALTVQPTLPKEWQPPTGPELDKLLKRWRMKPKQR